MKKLIALVVILSITKVASAQVADLSNKLEKLEMELQQSLQKATLIQIDVKRDEIIIRSADLNRAKDIALENGARYPERRILIRIPSISKHQSVSELKISNGQTLLENFVLTDDTLTKELKLGGREISSDLNKKLAQFEEYLGLEVQPRGLSLVERSYRICWAEYFSRQRNKKIELYFEGEEK